MSNILKGTAHGPSGRTAKDAQAIAATSTASVKPKAFYGYVIVFALIVCSFVPLSLALSCVGIFYPSISAHLGIGTGTLSYYMSILWFGGLVALPFCGKLFARVPAKVSLTGATAIVAVGFVVLSFTSSIWQYFGCAFAMGLGVAMLLFVAPGTLINRWFAKRAGAFIGIVMAFTGVGGVVWSTVGGALINSVGWSGTYLVFAAITAATLPLFWLTIADRPSAMGLKPYGLEEQGDDAEGSGVREQAADGSSRAAQSVPATPAAPVMPGMDASKAVRTTAFTCLVLLCLWLNVLLYAYNIIPSYLGSLPLAASMPLLGATAASAAMAGQTVAKVVLGSVGDKNPVAGTIAALVMGICGLALFIFGSGSALLMYAAAVLYGVEYGIANVMMPVLTQKAFGPRDYATIYSRISMAATIGSIVGGFIWGTLITITGGYTVVFAGIIGISLAGCATVIAASRAMTTMSVREPRASALAGAELATADSDGAHGMLRKAKLALLARGEQLASGIEASGAIMFGPVNEHAERGELLLAITAGVLPNRDYRFGLEGDTQAPRLMRS